MKKSWLVLLLATAMLAAGRLQPAVTCAPDDGQAVWIDPVRPNRGQAASAEIPLRCLVGTADTIGGTMYDWQGCGPVFRFLANAPGHGISATWMWLPDSLIAGTRTMRYQFYDFSTRRWKWIDPDFMQSGVSAFPSYSGFGSIDVTSEGLAVISRHGYDSAANIHPDVARELAPGSENFEYAEGAPLLNNLQRPPLAVGQGDIIHVVPVTMDDDDVAATRIAQWPQFDSARHGFNPLCGEHSHNIAASKQSGKVCAVWTDVFTWPTPAWYRESADSGRTWLPPVELDAPPAFGGETLASFHITSLFPYYDSHDRLHIVTDLFPAFQDSLSYVPSVIWHWCADNDPAWSEVHRAGCDPANLQGDLGWNAIYACRPCLGEDSRDNLYCSWEQFDSANVEVQTNRLRADIFVAASEDNGRTWLSAVKLTDAGTGSCRFPSIPAMIMPGEPDTFMVSYMVDQVAGFQVEYEGPYTANPIIVQKVPGTALGVSWPGIADGPMTRRVVPLSMTIQPNPFRSRTTISLQPAMNGPVALSIFDASGRCVRTFAANGELRTVWDGTSELGQPLPSGTYFVRADTGNDHAASRVVLQRSAVPR